jgi:hypothetical protein
MAHWAEDGRLATSLAEIAQLSQWAAVAAANWSRPAPSDAKSFGSHAGTWGSNGVTPRSRSAANRQWR